MVDPMHSIPQFQRSKRKFLFDRNAPSDMHFDVDEKRSIERTSIYIQHVDNMIEREFWFEFYHPIVNSILPFLPEDVCLEIIKHLVQWNIRWDSSELNFKSLLSDPGIRLSVHDAMPMKTVLFRLRRSTLFDLDRSYLRNIRNCHWFLYMQCALGSAASFTKYQSEILSKRLRYLYLAVAAHYSNIGIVDLCLDLEKTRKNTIVHTFAAEYGALLDQKLYCEGFTDIVFIKPQESCTLDKEWEEYYNLHEFNKCDYIKKIKYGVETQIDDDGDQYIICKALQHQHLSTIQNLIACNDDVVLDFAFEENYAFRYAAKCGHLDVLQFLMQLDSKYGKIDPAAKDNYALTHAASKGQLNVVEYLMELDPKYGVDPASQRNLAFILAAENNHLDVMKYLLALDPRYGIDPAAQRNEALIVSASWGHLDIVKYLMTLDPISGIDPSACNNKAIVQVCTNGHLDVLQYLMSLDLVYGINPAVLDNEALISAAANGHLHIVQYLVSLAPMGGINPAARRNEALIRAASNGELDTVRYLIGLHPKYGIDRAARNNEVIRRAEKFSQEFGFSDVVDYLRQLDIPW